MTGNVYVIAQIAWQVPFTSGECVLICHVLIPRFYNPTPILFSFIWCSKDHYGYSFRRGKNLSKFKCRIKTQCHFSMCSHNFLFVTSHNNFYSSQSPVQRSAWGFTCYKLNSIVSPETFPLTVKLQAKCNLVLTFKSVEKNPQVWLFR